MLLRKAEVKDIPGIQEVRNAVKENRLSDPALVTDDDCRSYMTRRGRGWVCEDGDRIIGFAIVSITDGNVWALFVLPEYEKRGIGRQLHDMMMNWYFVQTNKTAWLSTDPGTRAEHFYRRAGWKEAGLQGAREIRFEMTAEDWSRR